MLTRAKQESSESAALGIHGTQIVFLQQNGEKPLGQVLRLFARQSLATDKSVERVPVMGAHRGQRPVKPRMTLAPSCEDHCPMGSGEAFARNGAVGLRRDHTFP